VADIEVLDRYGGAPTDRALAVKAARAARQHAGAADLAVSVLLTDDDEIARLHGEHLGDPTPTDVMSFALDGGVEVVVSVQCAEAQARAGGSAREAELALYVVHGVLHACGFDDTTPSARERMRAAERAVLDGLGLRVARVE
jgi:probable rRNA maturation factor